MKPVLNENFREFFTQCEYFFIRINSKYPLYLNKEAFSILKLCDGSKTELEIAEEISNQFSVSLNDAKENVMQFIEECKENNIINRYAEYDDKKIKIEEFGGDKLWVPLHLIIELTMACNLKCTHCYASAGIGVNMDNATLDILIDEIISLRIGTVQLTGGEPTLHPSFPKVVKKLIENKVNVTVTTNGYYGEEVWEYFTPFINTDNYIQISIDGLENSHIEIRKEVDSFLKSMITIKSLSEKGVKVKALTCLVNQSESEIIELAKILKEHGVKGYILSMLDEQGRAGENNLTSIYDIKRVMNLVNVLKNTVESNEFKIETFEMCDFQDNMYFENCGAGYNIICINPLGEVKECQMSENPMGLISREYSLTKFLVDNCYKMQDNAKRLAPRVDICGDCEKKKYCNFCVTKAKSMNCPKYV